MDYPRCPYCNSLDYLFLNNGPLLTSHFDYADKCKCNECGKTFYLIHEPSKTIMDIEVTEYVEKGSC